MPFMDGHKLSGEHKDAVRQGQVLKKSTKADSHGLMKTTPASAAPEQAPTLKPWVLPGVTLLSAYYRDQWFSRHTHDGYALGVILSNYGNGIYCRLPSR